MWQAVKDGFMQATRDYFAPCKKWWFWAILIPASLVAAYFDPLHLMR